jgi:hypothetical protein
LGSEQHVTGDASSVAHHRGVGGEADAHELVQTNAEEGHPVGRGRCAGNPDRMVGEQRDGARKILHLRVLDAELFVDDLAHDPRQLIGRLGTNVRIVDLHEVVTEPVHDLIGHQLAAILVRCHQTGPGDASHRE